ncbi:Cna protein B-type domain protein [compost metagenome]
MDLEDSLLLKQSGVISLSNQGEVNVNLTLEDAPAFSNAILLGTVYDTTLLTGAPISDATVVVYDASGAVVSFGITNSLGQYEISDLVDAAAYTVNATKDGYTISASSAFTASATTVTTVNFALLPNTNETLNTVYGIVVDNLDAPIEDATVVLINSTNSEIFSITTTIDDGEYAIYNVPAGSYLLKVIKQGYISPSSTALTLTTSENESQNVILTIDSNIDNGVITGIITDSASAAVENAFVALYTVDAEDVPETIIDYTFTNSAGRYIFGSVLPGSYVIKAKLSTT